MSATRGRSLAPVLRGGESVAATFDGGQATPDPAGLAVVEGVRQAVGDDRTDGAEGFG